MTKTFPLPNNRSSGGQNLFQSLFRALFLIAATIGGFFIFAASAAFALFVVIGILILGFIAFAVLWIRAKILGKPLRPAGNMWSFQTFDGQTFGDTNTSKANDESSKPKADGPVLDAHKTPDGWSVDTD